MPKIKILRIITRMNIGGPARQAALLSSELGKRGFDCVLLTGSISDDEGDMSYVAAESGIGPLVISEIGREISFLSDLSGFFRVYKVIRKEKPQIVHTHMAKAGTIGRLAAKIAGVPIIIHTFHGHIFHSYFSPFKTRVFVGIERLLASMTDKIVVISAKQKDEIKKCLNLSGNNKLVLIPLGFDLEKFMTDKDEKVLRHRLNIPEDALVVGIVGRLTAIKNHTMFLKAAAEIKKKNAGKAIRFIVVGDGEHKSDLTKLSSDLGLKDDVIFTGWRKDIDALYRAMDAI
jgi:glycosyltransferase involved in cell wall biosynthesis